MYPKIKVLQRVQWALLDTTLETSWGSFHSCQTEAEGTSSQVLQGVRLYSFHPPVFGLESKVVLPVYSMQRPGNEFLKWLRQNGSSRVSSYLNVCKSLTGSEVLGNVTRPSGGKVNPVFFVRRSRLTYFSQCLPFSVPSPGVISLRPRTSSGEKKMMQ